VETIYLIDFWDLILGIFVSLHVAMYM